MVRRELRTNSHSTVSGGPVAVSDAPLLPGERGAAASADVEALEQRLAEASSILAAEPREAFGLAEAVLSQAAGGSPTYARALRVRAMACGALGMLEDSFRDFQAAARMACDHGDLLLESQCLHGLAKVHQHRGDFALALEAILRANALRREIGDDFGLMAGFNSHGAFLAELGDLQGAVTCFYDSLRIARRLGSGKSECLALTNIGHLKMEGGQPEIAVSYLRKSLAIAERVNARIYQPFTLEVLASALHRLDRLEEALATAERSIRVCRDIGNPYQEVNSLCALAPIQMAMGDLEGAEATLLRALEMADCHRAGRSIADIYGAMGRLYTRTGDFARAEELLRLGLLGAGERRQQQQVCDLHLALSELYAASGDYAKALAAHADYHEAYKALEVEGLQNRLGAQRARLQVERAQQEAEIHRRRTVELAKTNREKERLLDRIRRQARQLAELAVTDPLTGLYNRRYLRDFLCGELPDQADPCSAPLSLALLDLDDFKQINDRFSHGVGDEVLVATARLIRQSVRGAADVVVRYGGEEFVVVLPGMARAEALPVCETIRAAVAAYDWSRLHPALRVTASLGVAESRECAPGEGDDREPATLGERLLVLADERLYRAKASGKNRVL